MLPRTPVVVKSQRDGSPASGQGDVRSQCGNWRQSFRFPCTVGLPAHVEPGHCLEGVAPLRKSAVLDFEKASRSSPLGDSRTCAETSIGGMEASGRVPTAVGVLAPMSSTQSFPEWITTPWRDPRSAGTLSLRSHNGNENKGCATADAEMLL
jgi:hypothetical protein